jgi:hypothetical protein
LSVGIEDVEDLKADFTPYSKNYYNKHIESKETEFNVKKEASGTVFK